jgi:flavorubredoxin
MSDIHEIADGTYRIATFVAAANLTFNQFLIVDEKPLLFHTGQRLLFPQTVEAVRRLVDPALIRYISWSHWEADESGALNEFLQVAPEAEAVHGQLGVRTNVNDFAIRPARAIKDGELLELGRHRLRFLVTPHVPHAWDAILAYDETTGLLLASDLFTQRGQHAAVTEHDMTERTVRSYVEIADELAPYLVVSAHTARVFDRLEALNPSGLACMH